ncbi:hypothetical protein [Rossellomorea sp. NRS-1567]|uniref:hypothetical protein n=1 Tax=Rossellomorea sp. NRS-1567 TaxID=3233901 RepID=UPI003D2C00F9
MDLSTVIWIYQPLFGFINHYPDISTVKIIYQPFFQYIDRSARFDKTRVDFQAPTSTLLSLYHYEF